MRDVPIQGETVNLSLLSASLSNTSSVAIGLYDALGKARTLAAYETLLIDDLQFSTTTTSATQTADLLNVAAGASSVTQATLIAAFQGGSGSSTVDFTAKEGKAIPVGITPSVLASASGLQVALTGTGRIVTGKTQGVRPNWRESLNGAAAA